MESTRLVSWQTVLLEGVRTSTAALNACRPLAGDLTVSQGILPLHRAFIARTPEAPSVRRSCERRLFLVASPETRPQLFLIRAYKAEVATTRPTRARSGSHPSARMVTPGTLMRTGLRHRWPRSPKWAPGLTLKVACRVTPPTLPVAAVLGHRM
jgi:hypothetical protein